jgi:PqqD family protein of HPr-rel-A system
VTQTRYRAEPEQALRSVALDGLNLLYHRPSGQTHIMVEPMPEIVAALGARAMTITELMADFALDAADQPLLQARLDELLTTGLIAAH